MPQPVAVTCADVQRMLDAFVDTELPPPLLLAVARHAAGCPPCEASIRELTDLREVLCGAIDQELETVDLRQVWPAVCRALERQRTAVPRAWPGRRVAVWGGLVAMAASLAMAVGLWNGRRPVEHAPVVASRPTPVVTARAELRNRAAFDRLWGRGIEVKREPKAGTTVVWVSHVATTRD